MDLYIARHGQTRLNAEHRAQGRNGEPLNEVGIEQAKKLKKKFDAEKIKFDYIYSSPQERAIQTAKISTGENNIIIDDRLNVYDLGSADGMLMSEIKITGTVPDMSLYDGVEQLCDRPFPHALIRRYHGQDKAHRQEHGINDKQHL